MGGSVDFLQLANRNLRVNLCRRQISVSEQLLDKADVRAVLVHKRRTGMAEQMTGSLLADLGGLHVVADKLR